MKIWEQLDECCSAAEIRDCLVGFFVRLTPAVKHTKPLGNSFADRAMRMIQEQCGDNQLSLQSVANELNMHPVTLSKLFKRETGRNFHDFVTEARMERAKFLLRESNLKIYEIGDRLGYSEMRYFTKIFKKTIGVTPKEYRYGK
ncbi:MAG: two component transcriptional regulator, AraC family [Paenibacillus sp.]|nr:two component transcriptional regulator, AraC family [Paenibacillus sp.]